jgi:hypothetical protein
LKGRQNLAFLATPRAIGTGPHAAGLIAMHHLPEPDTATDFEDAEQSEAVLMEDDINEMVRRLAASMDNVVNPGRDSRILVAEALMRLALGVHVYAAGPECTRQRLLAMALRTSAGSTVN